MPLIARLTDAAAAALAAAAAAPELPFAGSLPAAEAATVARLWQDLFGGWQGNG